VGKGTDNRGQGYGESWGRAQVLVAHTATNAITRTHALAGSSGLSAHRRTEALVGPAAVGLQDHLRRNRATMSRLKWATHEKAAMQLRNHATTQRCATTNIRATCAGLCSMQPQWRTAVTDLGVPRREYSEYPVRVLRVPTVKTAVTDLLDVSVLRMHRRDRLERRDPLIRRLADPYPDRTPT
jgi:hypothetical protein